MDCRSQDFTDYGEEQQPPQTILPHRPVAACVPICEVFQNQPTVYTLRDGEAPSWSFLTGGWKTLVWRGQGNPFFGGRRWGRIALSPSLRFGLGGVLFLYIFQPAFEWVTDHIPLKTQRILFRLLLAIFLLDCAATVVAISA